MTMKVWRATRIEFGNGNCSRTSEYVVADDIKEASAIAKTKLGEVSLIEQMPSTFKLPAKLIKDDLGEDAKVVGTSIIVKGTS